MLDFLWSAQGGAGSHILFSQSCSPSVSHFYPLSSSVLSFVLSFVFRKCNALSVFFLASLSLVCLLFLSPISASHFCPLISPLCQPAVCSSSPSWCAAAIQCCASLLRFGFVRLTCAFTPRVCIGLLSRLSFVWIWHKLRLSWTRRINSLQCLALAELGWELQPAFHCRV